MSSSSKKALLKASFITFLSAAILGLFVWLSWQSREAPTPAGRMEYTRIDCPSPPGMTKREFLDELRYLGLPEKIDLRAENRDLELTALFERHPQVDKVVSILERRSPGDGQVELVVELRFKAN